MSEPRRFAAHRTRRMGAAAVVGAIVLAACGGTDDERDATANSAGDAGTEVSTDGSVDDAAPPAIDPADATRPVRERYVYPDAPAAPPEDDESNTAAAAAVDRILDGFDNGFFDTGGVTELRETGDVRHAWFVADLLRFFGGSGDGEQLVFTFETLAGVQIDDDPDAFASPWLSVTNHLIAWDTPAYPGYQEDKAGMFLLVEPGWEPFFTDEDAAIDWRVLSWGGVFIDDRELGDPNICPDGCIPALDDPQTTDAAGGDWYPDERTVFGIEVNGDALAIPLNIAEIHEMFNLELGGRRLGIPYCTLCGSAQAYFTDQPDGSPTAGATEVPVLRTSGLLSLSNKVMYDLVTQSVFDTFTGDAVSGPLQDAGVVLEETTVVRSTWAEWKAEHPDTQIIAEDGGIGRSYDLDPLGDRDDDGPIFPIGAADDRLDVQELIVGVLTDDGTAVAFPSDAATATFAVGGTVELAGVELRESGDGLVAIDTTTGDALAAHEAFWFAWNNFHPDTLLWEP